MDELTKQMSLVNEGAKFRRIDLHIHSLNSDASPADVTDGDHTPQKIVDTAVALGFEVISITDHNSVANVEAAIQYAEGKNILVVPGVELSTSQGHLLLYAPVVSDLSRIIARLDFSGDMCTNTIAQCLDEVKEVGGFGIAAHIDKQKGFEQKLSGYGEDKKQLFLHHELLGIEFCDSSKLDWYTDVDSHTQRRAFVEQRRQTLHEPHDYNIAHVSFSDAHELTRVGKDGTGDDCLTRAKMDDLTFSALKTAFLDPGARIRAEKQIPRLVPQFTGMKIEGGFLDGQVISFNSNLTCIIGGRGTGKSTLLESLRAASGNPSGNGLIDSEVWPERISLLYKDETGTEQLLSRQIQGQVSNETDPLDGILEVPIESYGQGDTARTIKNSDKDPGVLLSFLDDFLDLDAEKANEESLRQALLDNQTSVERLDNEVQQLPEIRRRHTFASTQLGALKANNAKQLIEHEQALVDERTVRESIAEDLEEFEQQLTTALSDKQSLLNIQDLEDSKLLAGKTELAEIKKLVKTFEKAVDESSESLSTATAPVLVQMREKLATWKTNEAKLQQKINGIRAGLEKKGITLDYAFIRKTIQDVTDYSQKIKDLTLKTKQRTELQKQRRQLLSDRKANLSAMYAKRLALARKLNAVFSETVEDYKITIKYKESLHSPELKQLLQDVMGWRTNQVIRADMIADNITIFELLDMVQQTNTTKLEALKYDGGEKVFVRSEAREVLTRLAEPANYYKLERCKTDDRPQITVSKQIIIAGKTVTQVKDFGKLSLGQQQSVVLTILLFSETSVPLIIDQPEDDLDSEFIYKTLVKNLRRVKERRQVILVTHNANIAVLGDAELILPLRASSDKSVIKDRGSIDNEPTKDITCTILEGSKEAFTKRKRLYGI